jgi:tetratricopeptide (TPR) repeat protein
VKASPIQVIAAAAGVAALGLGMALGLYQSLLAGGGLPNISLDYVPEIRALEQSGDVEGAIRELRMATAVDAGNPGVANLLEEVAARAGDLDSRIVALRAQLRVRPFDAEARVRLSQAFVLLAREQAPGRAQRTLVRAIWHAEKAVQSAPDSAPAHLALAGALRAAGQEQRAQAELAQAGRLDPALVQVTEAESL